jgi:hypothetical protein
VYFAELAERLSAHPKVGRVTVNAETASVLLQHEGTIQEIAADLRDAFPLALRLRGPAHLRTLPRLPASAPVRILQLLALSCFVLGAYQIRRGRLFGTASESVWNAYNAWRNTRSRTVATALLGGGLVQLARGEVLSSAASLIYYGFILNRLGRGPSNATEKVNEQAT